MTDSQELSRDMQLVLQMLDYSQLPVSIFVTLRTDSVVHQNPSKNHISISQELHP